MAAAEAEPASRATKGKGPAPLAKGAPKGAPKGSRKSWRDSRPTSEPWTPAPGHIVLEPMALYDAALADEARANGLDEGPQDRLKLVCFDFDRTLAAIHLYNSVCIGGSSDAELLASYRATYEAHDRDCDVFGGSGRLEMLRQRLLRLKELGVRLYVVTMGSSHLVNHCLQRNGLQCLFDGISDDNPKQATAQVLMNTRFPRRLRADQAILVDDTCSNLWNATTQDQYPEQLRFTHGEGADAFFQRFYMQGQGYAQSLWRSHFEAGDIGPSGQGYCKAMLVGGEGISEQQLDALCAAASE